MEGSIEVHQGDDERNAAHRASSVALNTIKSGEEDNIFYASTGTVSQQLKILLKKCHTTRAYFLMKYKQNIYLFYIDRANEMWMLLKIIRQRSYN